MDKSGNEYFKLDKIETDVYDVIFKFNNKRIGSIYREVDGEYVYQPLKDCGFFTQTALKYLYDLIEIVNFINNKLVTAETYYKHTIVSKDESIESIKKT